MKKKCILIGLLLISLFMTNNYTSFAAQSELSVPPMYKNLKGKDELMGFLSEIGTIRTNISTITITPVTVKESSSKIKREINFYISELSSVENSIKMFEKKYNNSQPDLLFSQQISIILNSYKMSLSQQLVLVDGIMSNEVEATRLFHSDYLTYIYYYLNLGDQMISYIETFYNL